MSLWNDHEPDPRDFDDDENGSPKSKQPRCKFCGSTDVSWIHTGVRWRLYDDEAKNLHVCARTATTDDFDDLTKD
jgi:hypothetical protein